LREPSVFERCRGIPALQVARMEGLKLTPRGNRHWACCPIHGERTPSMMFDEAGRWHCFGCGRGGDAVALIAALRGISALQAARLLAGGSPAPAPNPKAAKKGRALALKARVDAWYQAQWDGAIREKRQAEAMMDALTPGTQAFYQALARRCAAEIRLDGLLRLSPKERLQAALSQETLSVF